MQKRDRRMSKKFEKYFTFNFSLYCEWMQLIQRFITKSSYFNWYDITVIDLSYEYMNYDVLAKQKSSFSIGGLLQSDKYIIPEDLNKISTTTLTFGLLGFVFSVFIHRWRKP